MKTDTKWQGITVETKLQLIEEYENGKSKKAISEKYKIGRNTLHYIFKHRDKFKDVKNNQSTLKAKRIRDVRHPELDQRIAEGVHNIKERGEKVTGNLIKTFALTAAKDLNIRGFSASNGWLSSFLKRHQIRLSEFNSETSAPQIENSMTWTVQEDNDESHRNVQNEVVQLVEDEEIVETEIVIESSCSLCGSCNGHLTDMSEEHSTVVAPFVEVGRYLSIVNVCRSSLKHLLVNF